MSVDQLPSPMTISGETQPAQGTEYQWTAENTPTQAVEFQWDMGDGTVRTTSNPSVRHTYTAADEFTITCSALNSAGSVMESASLGVRVVPTGDNSFAKPTLESISSPSPGAVEVEASTTNQITQGDGVLIEQVDIVLYDGPAPGGAVPLDRATVGPIQPGETSRTVMLSASREGIEGTEVCVETENEVVPDIAGQPLVPEIDPDEPFAPTSLFRDCATVPGDGGGGGGGGGGQRPGDGIDPRLLALGVAGLGYVVWRSRR